MTRTLITRPIPPMDPAVYERSKAVESLHYGDVHAKDLDRDDLDGFGYMGLGLIQNSNVRHRAVVQAAMIDVTVGWPDDAKVINTRDGKRLLVRVFDNNRNLTAAYRRARKFADLAGV